MAVASERLVTPIEPAGPVSPFQATRVSWARLVLS